MLSNFFLPLSPPRLPNLLEYLRDPLQSGLGDRSAYVRKTAVMGTVKIFYFAPEFVRELNLVDVLYQMVRDKDPQVGWGEGGERREGERENDVNIFPLQVVSNCVSALNEILASEGGMVVNSKIAHYLYNRFPPSPSLQPSLPAASHLSFAP